VKAASLSPLLSVAKQGTSDAGSCRPGSTKIITVFPNEENLEKKRRAQSSDMGKKLICRKSLCLQQSKQQRGKSKRGPVSGGKNSRMPMEPVLKAGISEVKSLISPPSELGVSSGPEEEEEEEEEEEGGGGGGGGGR